MAAPRKGKTTGGRELVAAPRKGKQQGGGSSWRPLARENNRGAGDPEFPFRKALSLTEFLEAVAANNRLLRAVCGVLSAVCATLEMWHAEARK